MNNYNEFIDLIDYPTDYEVSYAYLWLHPEYLPKKIISLGKYDNGYYKMPERYTNYTFLSGKPLSKPVTVPIVSFDKDLFKNNNDITDLILSRFLDGIPKEGFMNMKNLKRIWIPTRVSCILIDTFKGCDNLEEVYFEGTEEEFNKIDIYYKEYKVIHKPGLIDDVITTYNDGNLPLIKATKYFNVVRSEKLNCTEMTVTMNNKDITNILK